MRQYAPPPDVAALCARLREAGFPAYPVGGAVRDLVLGRLPQGLGRGHRRPAGGGDRPLSRRPPHGPLPRHRHADHVQPGGGSHHLPTGRPLLRRPAAGLCGVRARPDHRPGPAGFHLQRHGAGPERRADRPLRRRGGHRRRQLRCVGDPSVRLQEDVLRMLRAVRFCAQLDFDLGPAEQAVLAAHPQWVRRVSVERLRAELEQALLGAAPGRSAAFFRLGFLDHLPVRSCAPDLSGLAASPSTPCPAGRVCAIF